MESNVLCNEDTQHTKLSTQGVGALYSLIVAKEWNGFLPLGNFRFDEAFTVRALASRYRLGETRQGP